jgi:hypothetical protein
MTPQTYESLFARAQTEELGITITVINATRFQINACQWRIAHGQGRFDDIEVCVSSVPDQICLVKKSVELE